jgi:hypothetical protein
MTQDIVGTELSRPESDLVVCYRTLARTLSMHGDELPPFAHRNGLKALAALWQVMNGLDMDPGQLYDAGA